MTSPKPHITRIHHRRFGWCWALYTCRGGILIGCSQSFAAIVNHAYLDQGLR